MRCTRWLQCTERRTIQCARSTSHVIINNLNMCNNSLRRSCENLGNMGIYANFCRKLAPETDSMAAHGHRARREFQQRYQQFLIDVSGLLVLDEWMMNLMIREVIPWWSMRYAFCCYFSASCWTGNNVLTKIVVRVLSLSSIISSFLFQIKVFPANFIDHLASLTTHGEGK